MIPAALGHTLRQARQACAISQRQLAERLGVHHAVVSRWEAGSRTPSLSHVYAICRALNQPLTAVLPPALDVEE